MTTPSESLPVEHGEAHLLAQMKQGESNLARCYLAALADLARCFHLSGADPDGNEDWRLASSAVKEVRRLRTEFDEAEARVLELAASLDAALRRAEEAEKDAASRNRGLMQAARQAAAALQQHHAHLPWGSPEYPAPTPGAALLYEARSYLDAAIGKSKERP